jgi:hypothetical protein
LAQDAQVDAFALNIAADDAINGDALQLAFTEAQSARFYFFFSFYLIMSAADPGINMMLLGCFCNIKQTKPTIASWTPVRIYLRGLGECKGMEKYQGQHRLLLYSRLVFAGSQGSVGQRLRYRGWAL